jgi:hypothetical protein
MSINPLQLAFYKGMGGKYGAVQFNPQLPHYYATVSEGEKKLSLKNFQGRFAKEEWKKKYSTLKDEDFQSREGAVFMEICSASGKNEYDWNNKIIAAFSVTDLSKILTVLEGRVPEVEITHDPHAKSVNAGKIQKYFKFSVGKDGIKAGVLINASQFIKGTEGGTKHMVPLSGDEVLCLAASLRAFIPRALAWT